MTKKTTKKKTTKKIAHPFADKAKKGSVTVHLLVGVSRDGTVITYHPSHDESMDGAICELQSSFEYGEHVEIHQLVTTLPLPKEPKPKTVRAKKIGTVVRESGSNGITHATNPGAA